MPTNDLVLLDSIIDKSRSYFGEDLDKSELFEIFTFDQILKNYDLSHEELEYGHVDSGDDGGIDGLFLLLDDNLVTEGIDLTTIRRKPEIRVVVVTCKYGAQFKQTPINSLISSLLELFDLSKTSDEILYPFEASIIEIREVFRKLYIDLADKNPSLKFQIYYASRGDSTNINQNITSRAKDLEAKLSELFSQVETSVIFLGASELLQIARKQKSYSLRIRFIENVISRAKTNYIILTTLWDYYNFVTDEDEQLRRYLFESNVRDYMGADNNVISDIKDSLESDVGKDNADFWWFSNGITLLASNAVIAGKDLSLENVQIVNGLQTTNAIYEHFYQTRRRKDERALLLKIIITDNEDVRGKIIKATNFQNVVDVASLRATDKIQKDLEEFLLKHDWFYDRRKNYYRNQGKPAERIISASYLGAAIRSLVLRSPSLSAEQQTRWMKEEKEYKSAFNTTWDLRVFLVCLEICKLLDHFLRNPDKPFGRVLGVEDKKAKYIVGIIYLAKVFKNVKYSSEDIESLQEFPTTSEIDSIVGHINACHKEYSKIRQKKKIQRSNFDPLIKFLLDALENNHFTYLTYEKSDIEFVEISPSVAPGNKSGFSTALRIASAFERNREFDKAIYHLERCLENEVGEEKQSILHHHIGRLCARSDNDEKALSHYKKSMDLGNQTSDVYAGYARALYKTRGDRKTIQEYFLDSIELDDTNAFAHNWYATFLKSINDWPNAKVHAQRALRLQPNRSMFLHNLALILIEKNPSKDDLLQAKELLEKAVKLDSKHFIYPMEVLKTVNEMLNE